MWDHPECFLEKMPKSVVQSNWFYEKKFDKRGGEYIKKELEAFQELESHGYDQIPTGSNWSNKENFEKLVNYCRKRIKSQHLLGFLQTPWVPTQNAYRRKHLQAIELVEQSMRNS